MARDRECAARTRSARTLSAGCSARALGTGGLWLGLSVRLAAVGGDGGQEMVALWRCTKARWNERMYDAGRMDTQSTLMPVLTGGGEGSSDARWADAGKCRRAVLRAPAVRCAATAWPTVWRASIERERCGSSSRRPSFPRGGGGRDAGVLGALVAWACGRNTGW